MKHYVKRLLTLAMTVTMILSLLSVVSFAADPEIIAEGAETFATDVAAFSGKVVAFTPETNGDLTVEITSCTPGYLVEVYADGEWLVDYSNTAAETVSFAVTGGVEYELMLTSYAIYSESLKFAAAGSISYKVSFLSNGEVPGGDEEPEEPQDPSLLPGASETNPKITTGTEWTFIGGGQTMWYLFDNYQNMMENGVYSMMLHVNSSAEYSVTYRGQDVPVDENGFVNFEMMDMTMQGQYLFSVTNHSDAEAFFGIEVRKRPVYVNNGGELQLGTNEIILDTSAVFTLYEFSPAQTGEYKITAAEGVVGNWGTAYNPVDNTPDKTNVLTWTCTAVGQSVMVGFTGAETTFATVERTGDYVKPEEIPWVIYENTYDFSFLLPDGEVVDVDLTVDSQDTFMGADGFYHYGSVCGPLMVANLKTVEINIQDAYGNGGLRAWILDENGKTLSKTDYNDALYAYYQEGTVPVTQELAVMLQELGDANGWWNAGGLVFEEEVPADLSQAWMQLCGYLKDTDGHQFENGSCVNCGEKDPDAGVTVSGKVTSAGDVDGTVTLELYKGDEPVGQTTALVGAYSFENVQPGIYTLKVTKQDHVTREYTVTVEAEAVVQDCVISLLGDVNGDGRVNIGDVVKLYSHARGVSVLTDEYQMLCANINGGSLNIGDVVALYGIIKAK